MIRRVGTGFAVLLLLAGCARLPREEPRAEIVRPADLGLGTIGSPVPRDRWWRAFGDDQLDALIDSGLAHNPSLDQALARVRAAQAANLAAEGARRPQVAIDADETWQRFPETYYVPPPYAGNQYWAGKVQADLAWNLDFWGRQAALIRQAGANVAASELDHASARLALTGSIVETYIDLRRNYDLEDIAVRTEDQRRRLLDLTRRRVAAGLDTQVELKNAEAAVPQAQGARLQASSDRERTEHRLAALAGHGTDLSGALGRAALGRPSLALETLLPLPDVLPMDLLARRPDVLAARLRIDAAIAGKAAAAAAFYPNVSLNAVVGFESIGLDTLLKSGSRIYGVGPAIDLPIFNAPQLRASYRERAAELDASVAAYNDAVLNAVRESADELTQIRSLAHRIEFADSTLDAAETAYRLAERRYAAGLGTQLVVLNAESQVLAVRRDAVALRAELAIARVSLLLTLGGSFNPQSRPPLASTGERQ